MASSWASESCCACLVTGNVSTMYSLSDPDTMQLFKECTNLWFQDEDGHLPQHLCIMCYKQCEIWKCFKTRCQENHRLMGYPCGDEDNNGLDDDLEVQPEDDGLDAHQQPHHTSMVKAELESEFVEHMNLADDFLEQEPLRHSLSYDPLEGTQSGRGLSNFAQNQKMKKKKRKEMQTQMRDAEYKVYQVSSKKPKVARPIVSHSEYGTHSVSSASQLLYMKTYRDFLSWKTAQAVEEITEDLLLQYFTEISKNLAASTLTNKLSHLVKTIDEFHKVKIDGFQRLRQFCRDVRARQLNNSSMYVMDD